MSEQIESPAVEEVNPLEVIETLEDDLRKAQTRLLRIIRMNPALLPGGSNNRHFGKRFQQAFELAQKEAREGLQEMESHVAPE